MAIEVTRDVIEAIARAARLAHPREACGLLLGEGARISEFREAANVHASPESHFELDPQVLIDAHRDERAGGLQLLGYFHSHPTGAARPSATDRAMAARDGKVWAIIAGEDASLWRDTDEGFAALSYSIVQG